MTSIRLDEGVWVVACDGAKALFLRNDGFADRPSLTTMDVMSHEDPPSRDIVTDRPGRFGGTDGNNRSAAEEPDFHDRAEADFLGRVAGQLDRYVQQGEARAVVLAAAPRALGQIRPLLSAEVRNVLVGEVAKDLTPMPVDAIARALAGGDDD